MDEIRRNEGMSEETPEARELRIKDNIIKLRDEEIVFLTKHIEALREWIESLCERLNYDR